VARAFVSAIDDWQVGWLDLAIEANRDWANNPGITLLQEALKNKGMSGSGAGKDKTSSAKISHRVCKICENTLSEEDIAILKRIPNQNIDYCNKHLPSHRREKIRT
jgi:hypothetical protein